MADAILCACKSCGKEFEPRPGKSNKYCSMSCYRDAQRSGQYKRGHGPDFPRAPCHCCGAMVERIPSRRRNGEPADKVFCSRACYDKSRADAIKARSATCQNCGSEFSPATDSKKYCSMECRKHGMKAKPKNCLSCGCLFTPVKRHASGGMISYNAGKTCSAECANQWIRSNPERKRKIGDAFRGSSHPNWQGGKSLLNNISNRGPNWEKQRSSAIRRDGACVDCGISNAECIEKYGRGLDVDHVVPFHNFTDYRKANALSNLECRCASCHRIAEAKRDGAQMILPFQDSEKRRHKGKAVGEKINTAKLTEYDVRRIRKRAASGETAGVIGIDYPQVLVSTLHAIIRRKTWRHVH